MYGRLDFLDKYRYDKYLINSEQNPFPEPPARNQVKDNPAKFLVGRSAQLSLLNDLYEECSKGGEPKLGIIQGSQGVGKSSLISWFIHKKQTMHNQKVFLVPFEMTSTTGNLDFEQFYEYSIKSLYQSKDLYWIASRVMIKIIKLWEEFLSSQEFNVLIDKLNLSHQLLFDLKTNPDMINNVVNQRSRYLSKFWDQFQIHFHTISSNLPTMNFSFLQSFFFSLFKNGQTFHAFNALSGSGEFEGFEITNENTAKQSFKTLISLIEWVSPQSIIIIVFDHLESAVAHPDAYIELFSLLIQFRQQHKILVLLSGTFDAFNSLENTVQEDMSKQIYNWSMNNSIKLSSLSVDEINQIVNHHLSDFWSENDQTTPSNYSLYPYSEKSIEYLYQYQNHDLRNTLETCFHDIKKMKENKEVDPVISIFDAFKRFRIHNTIKLKLPEQKLLRKQMMDPTIQNKNRSSNLEIGIYELLQSYARKTGKIYNVLHEPKLGKNKLKPDVTFEVGKGLGNTRKVAIEVKLFPKGKKIPSKDVKKTHSLLTSGNIDYLIWYSNRRLDQEKYNLDSSLWPRVGRDEELSDTELGYAGLVYFYREIMPDIKNDYLRISQLLKLAGINLDMVINQVNNLEKATEIKLSEPKEPGLDTYFTSIDEDTSEDSQDAQEKDPVKVEPMEEEPLHTPFISAVRDEIEKNSSKTYCAATTIIKGLRKQDIDLSEYPNEDDLANSILKIAEQEGLHTTPTRIYFNK